CIPTKVFLNTTWIAELLKKSHIFGITVENFKIDYQLLLKRKREVISRLSSGVASLLRMRNVKVINGTATLLGRREAEIKETGEKISADKIILATGSEPVNLDIGNSETAKILTSDDLLDLPELPESILIIGGGYIGVEMGQFLRRMGARVIIVEIMNRVVPTEDEEISKVLEGSLLRDGIEIYTNTRVLSVEEKGNNKVVKLVSQEKEFQVKVSQVAQSVGRKPNLSLLNCEKLGIATNNGAIVVNEKMETSVQGIYAVGDVVGGIMLAHVASAEGECAALNAVGLECEISYKAIPRCLYTTPEVASVGLTEGEARKIYGENIKISKFPFYANGKAVLMEETEGFVKVVATNDEQEILGVHIVGAKSTELISEAVLAIQLEVTAEELASVVNPHPTLSETLKEAAQIITGGAIHIV
ncbi:MAG: dihydrolipoyl dehydrogenase, partial [Fischerella sp.]|nr:dihydrolipoyl dehydrogenase [Fischerella sp.]